MTTEIPNDAFKALAAFSMGSPVVAKVPDADFLS